VAPLKALTGLEADQRSAVGGPPHKGQQTRLPHSPGPRVGPLGGPGRSRPGEAAGSNPLNLLIEILVEKSMNQSALNSKIESTLARANQTVLIVTNEPNTTIQLRNFHEKKVKLIRHITSKGWIFHRDTKTSFCKRVTFG
jgi:hypothetical protein